MMKPTFLNRESPCLTVMLANKTPSAVIKTIQNANSCGAEAYGVQIEHLQAEFQSPATYRQIFAAGEGRPFYVTNYRGGSNVGQSDEELAERLLVLAENGATLCDVMGDLFCKHPEELTDDAAAVERQRALIDALHSKGAEVLMSSHVFRFTPAERVLEIALEQQRRGADVVKIVTGADTMEQQIENLRITHLLKKELSVPFLFLSGGECAIHRRIGIHLGCCMALCVYEHDEFSTPVQPLLSEMNRIRTTGL